MTSSCSQFYVCWGAPKWASGRKSLLHNPCVPFRTTLPHALTPPERCASPSEYDTFLFRLWFSHHGRVMPVSVRKPLQSPNSSQVASPAFLTNQQPARGRNRTGSLRFRPPQSRAPTTRLISPCPPPSPRISYAPEIRALGEPKRFLIIHRQTRYFFFTRRQKHNFWRQDHDF